MGAESVLFLGGPIDGEVRVLPEPLPEFYPVPVRQGPPEPAGSSPSDAVHYDLVEYRRQRVSVGGSPTRTLYVFDGLSWEHELLRLVLTRGMPLAAAT